jgi:sugar (pentulose or hexulose) kinase
MTKLIATHEVDDVAHWLASPKRAEMFGPFATDLQTYVDPTRPNFVGLSGNITDMDAFKAMMESEAGAEAMKYDGVRPETLVILFEA